MEKQLPQWVFRPQLFFCLFCLLFFHRYTESYVACINTCSSRQHSECSGLFLSWQFSIPAYKYIHIFFFVFVFVFFLFFFSSSRLFTHVLQIFSLGKLVQVTHRRKNSTVNFPLSLSNFANISFSYFFDKSINLRPLSLCYTKKMFMFESESPLRRHLYLKHYKQNSFLIFFFKSTSLLTSYSNSYSKSDENKKYLSYTTLQRWFITYTLMAFKIRRYYHKIFSSAK